MMRWLSILLFSAMAAAACSKSAPEPKEAEAPAVERGPRHFEESEPNDSVATATAVDGAAVITAALAGDKGDEDFYRLEPAGADKVASFEVSGIPGVDVRLELLDRDGNPVASFNSEAEGGGEKVVNIGLGSPWIVKVLSAKRGSGGAYTATVTVGPAMPGAELEPNNRSLDATALALGEPMRGLLSDKADEDWYRIEVPLPSEPEPADSQAFGGAPPAVPSPGVQPPGEPGTPEPPPFEAPQPPPLPSPGMQPPPADPGEPTPSGVPPQAERPAQEPPLGVIRLEISGVPDVRLQVEVANAAEAIFYTARSREPGEGIQVRNLALRPGETSYFVIVKSAWTGIGKSARRGSNATEPYTLTISPEEAGANAEHEPNDEAEKATPMGADDLRQGYLAPKGDVDYFRIEAEVPSLVRVELSGVDRVDSTLSLAGATAADGKEQILLKANDGGVRAGELLMNVAAGPGREVLVRVETASRLVGGKWVRDQENPDEPYRLTTSSRPDDGTWEREPNDSAATATPIEFGSPVRGHIHPRKDVDYFRLDLTDSLVKVPLRADLTGILKVDVALGLFRVGDDGQLVLVQRSETGKADKPESIRYTAEPGIYLLEVRDTKGLQSNFIDAYQLVVDHQR